MGKGVVFLLLGVLFSKSILFAQINIPLGSVVKDSLNQWISPNAQSFFYKTFFEKTRDISPLLNGREYNPSSLLLSEGTFFYNFEDWTLGDLVYSEIRYKNILLKYDLQEDVLICPYEKFDKIFQFDPEFLGEFHIYGKTFIQFIPKPEQDSMAYGLKTGIYQILYSGKTKIWAKRIKKVDKSIVSGKLEYFPVSEDHYFIFTGGHFTEFSSLGTLLKVTGSQRNNLEKFINQENIKYKKDPELAMVLLAKELDSLEN